MTEKLQPRGPVKIGDILPDVLKRYGIESPRKEFRIWFDGACEPRNPGGVATCGWIIELDGETIEEGSQMVRRGEGATNNVAEYAALGLALRAILDSGLAKPGDTLAIMGDSKLVIETVAGNWQCHKEHLAKLRDRCRELLRQLDVEWSATWVPREQNERADALSQRAYVEVTGKPFPQRARK